LARSFVVAVASRLDGTQRRFTLPTFVGLFVLCFPAGLCERDNIADGNGFPADVIRSDAAGNQRTCSSEIIHWIGSLCKPCYIKRVHIREKKKASGRSQWERC